MSDGDTYYPRLKLKDVKTVVEEHLAGGQVVEKLLYVDPATGERIACAHDIPFYKAQTASRCATSASSTRRAWTSTWRGAATRPRARRSRR